MEIRPAETDDAPEIRRVARASWAAAYEEILDDDTVEETVADWYSDETLADALDRPGTAFLVAVEDDELVGFCHGVCQGDEGDVVRMYVHPDHWRRGIGTRLHERLRDDLLDINMKRMRAIVMADNEMGNEFYRARGFERTGEGRVEIGGDSYDETVYTREF